MQEAISLLFEEDCSEKTLLRLFSYLCLFDEVTLPSLMGEFKGKCSEEDIMLGLTILQKRGLITIEERETTIVKVDFEKASGLAYHDLYNEFMLTRFDVISRHILMYLLGHSIASSKQVVRDVVSFFEIGEVLEANEEAVIKSFDELAENGYVISCDSEKLPASLFRFNHRKFNAMLRTELIVRFYGSGLTKQQQAVFEAVLNSSGLYGRADSIKWTEWTPIKSLSMYLMLNHADIFNKIRVADTLKDLAVTHRLIEFDVNLQEARVNLAQIVDGLRNEVLEKYLASAFKPQHLRVLRAISQLDVNNLKDITDNVLIPKKEVMRYLYDLEIAQAIKRPAPTQRPDYYETNISNFLHLLADQYWKMYRNLLFRMLRAPLDRENAKVATIKSKLALTQLSERLLILREL